MNETGIQWTGKTWNPVTGCTPVSEGCEHCYAARMAKRLAGRCGYPADDPFRVTVHPIRLEEPLLMRKPQTIFVCSMGDLFHEDVPIEFVDQVFAVMALTPHLTYQVLTKRPGRMLQYINAYGANGCLVNACNYVTDRFIRRLDGALYLADEITHPLPNVWLGLACACSAAAHSSPFRLGN